MNDDIKTKYVYCHECNELIAICKHWNVAYAAEKIHREQGCRNLTVGSKDFYDNNYPKIKLEFKKSNKIAGYRPAENEYPLAGLTSFEVYKRLEMGKECHPEVKEWITIYEGDIEDITIIPFLE